VVVRRVRDENVAWHRGGHHERHAGCPYLTEVDGSVVVGLVVDNSGPSTWPSGSAQDGGGIVIEVPAMLIVVQGKNASRKDQLGLVIRHLCDRVGRTAAHLHVAGGCSSLSTFLAPER